MALFGITRQYVWFAVPFTGYAIGAFLDNQETLRMTKYRDRSRLYGPDPGCPPCATPSWP